jgi:hypothetical protein
MVDALKDLPEGSAERETALMNFRVVRMFLAGQPGCTPR